MQVTVLGIDLAKNVLQLHGVDDQGKVVVRKQLSRPTLVPFVAQLAPCRIGMEACQGHTIGLAKCGSWAMTSASSVPSS